jgi:CheY-like chemotaxis protein
VSAGGKPAVETAEQIQFQTVACGLIALDGMSAATASRDTCVLVAEDNATNRLVALAQLTKLGFKAEAVVNGAEAVEALRHKAYDIILMDCSMPVMDGYEAAGRIRGLGGPRIPIIALTAFAMAGDRERCLDAGMDDFLSKPVDMQQLAEVLSKWSVTAAARREGGISQKAERSSATVFDGQAFLHRLMGDRRLANIVLDAFLGDFPSQLEILRGRFAEKDGPGARMQAHSLKGSSATVAAVSLSAIAQEMETAADAGELDLFDELLPRAAEEFERLKVELTLAGWQ